MLSKAERIIIAILVVAAGIGFTWFMLHTADQRVAEKRRQEQRTEADFVTRDYVLGEIWRRELSQQHGAYKQSYLFLKPEGEKFNLTFGLDITDHQGGTAMRDMVLRRLHPGDAITVLVDKRSLAAVLDDGLIAVITRFLSDSNRELEMYRLDVNGKTIYEQPLTMPSFEDRGFAMQNLLLAGFALALAYTALRLIVCTFFFRKKTQA